MLREVLLTIFANIGSLYFGCIVAWSSPSLLHIVENDEYLFWVTKSQFGLVVSFASLGGLFSCVPSGIIRHKIGTKRTIQLFSIPAVIGSFLITFPYNFAFLLLGRFLIGIALGCYIFLIQIYVGEISKDENRGILLNVIHIMVHTGVLFMNIIGQHVSLKTLNIICGIIPVFYAIGFQLIMPESVPYLMSKKKYEKAEQSMMILYKNKKPIDIEKVKSAKVDVIKKKTIKDLLMEKATRRATIIMTFQFFFFQMSGINAINFYSKTIFIEAGFSTQAGNASIINTTVLLASSITALFTAKRFGRRPSLFTFNSFTVLSMLSLGTYFSLKNYGYSVENITWLPLVALCVNSIAFCPGIATCTYGLLGELFTIEAKKTIAPFTQIMSQMLTFTIGLSFPFLSSYIGIGNIFFIFATMTFIDIIFVYFLIPETIGKSFDEIQVSLSK